MKSTTGFVYDDIYLKHLPGPSHLESPARLEAITSRIVGTGLKKELAYLSPSRDHRLIEEAILAIHSRTHFNSVAKWGEKAEPALCAVGGVLRAVDAVARGEVRNVFCAIRPPGHHARNHGADCDGRFQGEGFCFFNNIAVGARYAQRAYKIRRILIVDWDFHHGNGTEWAFYDDPSVFFFSTHSLFGYPGTGSAQKIGSGKGKGYNLNVPLPRHAEDSAILAAFEEKLIPALRELKFEPDLIMISAGFDSRKDDPLGTFLITDKGFLKLTRIMTRLAGTYCGGKLVSVLEGGYNPQGMAQAVSVHIRALLNGEKS